MTIDVSRRSLLALGAGLGATAMLGGSALAKAPKLGTQAPYFYRFMLGTPRYAWFPTARCRSALPRAPSSACPRKK